MHILWKQHSNRDPKYQGNQIQFFIEDFNQSQFYQEQSDAGYAYSVRSKLATHMTERESTLNTIGMDSPSCYVCTKDSLHGYHPSNNDNG